MGCLAALGLGNPNQSGSRQAALHQTRAALQAHQEESHAHSSLLPEPQAHGRNARLDRSDQAGS